MLKQNRRRQASKTAGGEEPEKILESRDTSEFPLAVADESGIFPALPRAEGDEGLEKPPSHP